MNEMTRITLLMLASAIAFSSGAAAQGGQPSLVSVTFASPTVPGGTNATAIITIDRAAPNNGFAISLAITSNVAQISSSAVTIGSGLTSTQVVVTTTPTATAQLATLTATAHNDSRTANLTVAPPSVRTLALSPTTVNAGQASTATITLDGPAPAGGTIIALTKNGSAVTIPASATVAAGQTTTAFAATTVNVAVQTIVTLGATAGGVTQSSTLTVLPPPFGIQSVNFAEGSPRSLAQNAVRVVLTKPAPAGGTLVQLTSSPIALLNGHTSAVDTVAAGQTTGFFVFFAPVTGSDQAFTLTATLGGVSVVITGTLLGPRIAGVELRDTVVVGFTPSASVVFNAGLPSSGVRVTVTSDNPAVGTNGSQFGSGNTEHVNLPISPVTTPTTAHLTFQANGSTGVSTLVIIPSTPTLTSFTVAPIAARAGSTVTLTVTLAVAAPAGGAAVNLVLPSTVAGLTAPPSILVPAGSTTGSARLTIPALIPTNVTLTIAATLNGVSKSASLTITP